MAYSVDWTGKTITIPTSDLDLVSGTRYQLNLWSFLLEIRRLEADPNEGLWAPQILDHSNTRVDFAGADYAPFDEVLNGYIIIFSGVVQRVDLVGSNNNLVDVFISPGVSVVPSNSAGLISDLNSLSAIAHMAFNNRVTINPVTGDSIASFTGDPSSLGNGQFPVNNIADAHIIAEREGFSIFYFEESYTIASESLTDGYIFYGNGANIVTLTIDPTADVTNAQFENMTLKGQLSGGHIVRECLIDGIQNFSGIIYNSGFTIAPFKLNGGVTNFFDCKSAVPGADQRPQIDFDGQDGDLAVRSWVGGFELVNKTNAAGAVTFDMESGTGYIRSSCTAGTITIRGEGVPVDESGAGCTVDVSGLMNNNSIADQVWDEELALHTTDGTYGAELATKADINAATSTDQSAAISGVATFGTVIAGDFASTAVRDNVYWQIQEDAANGIEVELTFNLPSAEHRPGSVNVFGRYNGFPAGTHYQDLFTFNYESASWEQLLEDFIPGGGASDANYKHEFYERHVDRGNNNEVRVKIKHNVTTYNDNHAAFYDYIDVSSIKVITAEDIADAVWDELITNNLHNLPTSAGKYLNLIKQSIANRRVWDKIANTITLYDDDGVTPLLVFDTNADMSEITPQ